MPRVKQKERSRLIAWNALFMLSELDYNAVRRHR
nr:MAG TPA: hypothetical protein [Caudoviricetes sp.]